MIFMLVYKLIQHNSYRSQEAVKSEDTLAYWILRPVASNTFLWKMTRPRIMAQKMDMDVETVGILAFVLQ